MRILKFTGILLLLMGVPLGGVVGWLMYEQAKYASTAVPYIKQAIPELAQWNVEVAKKYMAQEAITATPDAQFEQLFARLRKLGTLRSIEEPTFMGVNYRHTSATGKRKILTYVVKAEFSTGETDITLHLLDKDPLLQIYSFTIESKVLME